MKAPAIVLLWAAIAAAGQAMLLASSPPEDDAPEKPGDNLKKAQDALGNTDSGLKWLGRGAWMAKVVAGAAGLENVKEDFEKAKDALDEIQEPVSKLKEGVDQIKDIKDMSEGKDKAQNAANWFFDTLKLYRLDGQSDELDKMRRNIQDIPVGLVSDEVDDRFKVSADLVGKDPAEARARFGEYLEAMEANIDHLKGLQSNLEELQVRAEAARKVLDRLHHVTERAIEAGLFSEQMLGKYLEIEKLDLAYSYVASAAASKAAAAMAAAAKEQRRQDTLIGNFGVKFRDHPNKSDQMPVSKALNQFTAALASAAGDGKSGERLVVDDPGSKDPVGGVRILYEQQVLRKALLSLPPKESEKILTDLSARLGKEESAERQADAVRAAVRKLKLAYKAGRPLRRIDNPTAVSLKALVEKAEKYAGRWDQLPADLRHPGDLVRVHGFVLLPEQKDILLLGTTDAKAPPMELDDLIVAVRTVWKDHAVPACSLDPDPDDMAAGKAGPQKVRVLGVPRDSSFAKTMLDADYDMKRITFGAAPVEAPDYLTLKELIRRSPDPSAEQGSSRFWFVPVSPGPGEVLASPDGDLYLFSSDVQVLTEQVLFTREGTVGTGKVQRTREEAAASFTKHFAEIARQKTACRKLQTLFDLVLLTRLWQEKGLRSDLLDRLCALPYRIATVPDSYVGIKEDVINTPNASFWLVGGVEMRSAAGPRTWLVVEDDEMAAVRKKARGLRFADGPAATLDDVSFQAPIPSRNPRRETAALAVQAGLSSGDLKAALQAADQLVAADPWDDRSLILRALVNLRRGDYVQARGDAERARALDPGNPETAEAAAQVLFQCRWMEGDAEGALRETDAGLGQNPHSVNAEVARAEALTLLNKPDEARKALLKAVELDPTSALACARLALLELGENRIPDAKPWVAKARALDPNLPEVRIAAAEWELAVIRPDLAEKIAREVWEKEASGPTARLQALVILAKVSAAREKWDDVDNYVGRMDKLSAGSPEVLVAAAEIASTWGEPWRAKKYLEMAERLSPNHPLVRKLRAKMSD
jgi:Flp pilus assembly protein TadD